MCVSLEMYQCVCKDLISHETLQSVCDSKMLYVCVPEFFSSQVSAARDTGTGRFILRYLLSAQFSVGIPRVHRPLRTRITAENTLNILYTQKRNEKQPSFIKKD